MDAPFVAFSKRANTARSPKGLDRIATQAYLVDTGLKPTKRAASLPLTHSLPHQSSQLAAGAIDQRTAVLYTHRASAL